MLISNPPVKIADRLWMLGTAAYPLYLFKGEREGTIFEGGTGSMGPLVRQQVAQLGIGEEFVKRVVITHAHPDHVMAVPLLGEVFPAVTVLASETAAKTLAAEKAISFFCQIDDALTDSLMKADVIREEHRPKPLADKRIAVDRTLKEGDEIAVESGVRFGVLETPGHSECSLSFFEPREKILLVSDASGYRLPEHGYWWPDYFAGYEAYVGSINRLAALNAEILCLGHNAVITGAEDVESHFSSAISAAERYHARIIDQQRAGKTVRQIAEELGAEVYEKTQLLPLDFFQKNCGLLVKQSLRYEGIELDK